MQQLLWINLSQGNWWMFSVPPPSPTHPSGGGHFNFSISLLPKWNYSIIYLRNVCHQFSNLVPFIMAHKSEQGRHAVEAGNIG